MNPEPSNQDQNQRKSGADLQIYISSICCDFRIQFLVSANAMYQDLGEEDEIDQIVLFHLLLKCCCRLRKYR